MNSRFVEELALIDVRRHLLCLLDIAAKDYPNTASNRLGFSIYYTWIPSNIGVLDLDSRLLETQHEAGAVEFLRQMVQGLEDDSQKGNALLEIVHPSGKNAVLKRITTEAADRVREPPLLKPGVHPAGRTRPSAKGDYGRLVACYDEIDEFMHRLEVRARCDPPSTRRHPWEYIVDDHAFFDEGDDDWPFVSDFYP